MPRRGKKRIPSNAKHRMIFQFDKHHRLKREGLIGGITLLTDCRPVVAKITSVVTQYLWGFSDDKKLSRIIELEVYNNTAMCRVYVDDVRTPQNIIDTLRKWSSTSIKHTE